MDSFLFSVSHMYHIQYKSLRDIEQLPSTEHHGLHSL
jgi:hypothetical protein